MPFSTLYFLVAVVAVVSSFVVYYQKKGLRGALKTAGAVLILSTVGFVVIVSLIINE